MVSREAHEVKLKDCFITRIGHGMEQAKSSHWRRRSPLVPKLELGNQQLFNQPEERRQGQVAKGLSKNNLHSFQPFFEPRRTRRTRRNHFVSFVFFVVKEGLLFLDAP